MKEMELNSKIDVSTSSPEFICGDRVYKTVVDFTPIGAHS